MMIESLFRSKCDMLFLKGEEVMLAWKEYCLRDANSLVCQLENELGRTSWEKIDNPARCVCYFPLSCWKFFLERKKVKRMNWSTMGMKEKKTQLFYFFACMIHVHY